MKDFRLTDDTILTRKDYYLYSLHFNKFVGIDVDLTALLSNVNTCFGYEQSHTSEIDSEISTIQYNFQQRFRKVFSK